MKMRAKKGLDHDLDTSVWRSGKNGSSVLEMIASLAESVHPVCGSACSSAVYIYTGAGHIIRIS